MDVSSSSGCLFIQHMILNAQETRSLSVFVALPTVDPLPLCDLLVLPPMFIPQERFLSVIMASRLDRLLPYRYCFKSCSSREKNDQVSLPSIHGIDKVVAHTESESSRFSRYLSCLCTIYHFLNLLLLALIYACETTGHSYRTGNNFCNSVLLSLTSPGSCRI